MAGTNPYARKLVLFNGPPGSGKNTGADALQDTDMPVTQLALANILKIMTHRMFGIVDQKTIDAIAKHKDEPCPAMWNKTPREMYIAVSERLMKPIFGPAIWAEELTHAIEIEQQYKASTIVDHIICITDLGFECEIGPFLRIYKPEDILIIHTGRIGCSFEKDSRSYVRVENITTEFIRNDGTIDEYKNKVIHIVRWFCNAVSQPPA